MKLENCDFKKLIWILEKRMQIMNKWTETVLKLCSKMLVLQDEEHLNGHFKPWSSKTHKIIKSKSQVQLHTTLHTIFVLLKNCYKLEQQTKETALADLFIHCATQVSPTQMIGGPHIIPVVLFKSHKIVRFYIYIILYRPPWRQQATENRLAGCELETPGSTHSSNNLK